MRLTRSELFVVSLLCKETVQHASHPVGHLVSAQVCRPLRGSLVPQVNISLHCVHVHIVHSVRGVHVHSVTEVTVDIAAMNGSKI